MNNNKNVAPDAGADLAAHAPRPLTLAGNVILSIKVLGGAGVLGLALWAISTWTSK